MRRGPDARRPSGADAPPRALPPSPAPRGDYRPAASAGGLVWSAGMTPRRDGRLVASGRVGEDVDLESARAAASLAAANALAAIADALGGLHRVERVVHVTVYVAATPDFTGHSAVADGATFALASLCGERSAPSRVAVGVASLPGGAPVEVQIVAAGSPEPAAEGSSR
ncbi:MAG: RidA family protein [Actinomycetota bacterium]|nr:RidA family protein [Actinomycetota bacterium]